MHKLSAAALLMQAAENLHLKPEIQLAMRVAADFINKTKPSPTLSSGNTIASKRLIREAIIMGLIDHAGESLYAENAEEIMDSICHRLFTEDGKCKLTPVLGQNCLECDGPMHVESHVIDCISFPRRTLYDNQVQYPEEGESEIILKGPQRVISLLVCQECGKSFIPIKSIE